MRNQIHLLFRATKPPRVYRLARVFLLLLFSFLVTLLSLPPILDWIEIDRASEARLVIGLGLWLLVSLLIVSIQKTFRVLREKQKGVAGARIRLRMASLFILSGLTPLLLAGFLLIAVFKTGVEAVYDPDIENGLSLATRFIYESRTAFYQDYGRYVQRYFEARPGLFEERWKQGGIFRFETIGRFPIETEYLPEPLRRNLFLTKEGQRLFDELDQETTRLIYLHLTNDRVDYAALILHPIYGPGAESVVSSLADYRRLRLVKKPIATALISAMVFFASLTTLISLLLAIRFAKKITDPVTALVEGTRRIARGELDYRVQTPAIDEFGQLIDNFNQMSDELKQSRQRLYHAERIAAWQEVAKRLAHEIKNPLTPIQLGAERLLRQSRKGSEKLEKIIETVLPTIIGEVKTIENLVDEFSSFARLPQKRTSQVELIPFLEEIIASFREAHPDFVFKTSYDSELEFAVFDREQIKRGLLNLIQNGINAVARTERQGRIELGLVKYESGCMFLVRDNGSGISTEDERDVFSPYFSRSLGGSGLGLPIVEKIVIDHGGEIWFETNPAGTVFYLYLPAEKLESRGG